MQPLLVLFLLVAIIMNVVLMAFSATRQDHTRSIYFSVLATAQLFYSVGYLLEIMSSTWESASIALKVQNVGIPLLAPFFLLSGISLFHPKYLRKWMLPASLTYGFLMFTCVLFNDVHHLYYTAVNMVFDGQAYFVSLERGPLYVIHQVVSTGCFVMSYVILLGRFFTGSKKLRLQMINIIIGSLLAFAANVLNFTGILPTGLDPTPFALTLGMVLIAVSIFKDRIMDIVTLSSTMAVETMDDAMIALSEDWSFLFCNKKAKKLFPRLADLEGFELIPEGDWWPVELSSRAETGQVTFTRTNANTGDVHTYRANISSITTAWNSHAGFSIVIRDISDMTLLVEKLQELATVDPLTGILNRRQFLATVDSEMEKATRYKLDTGLIMYDLDHFKKVNDTYGHAAGDQVLCSVVNTIRKQLRAYDIFARQGGEEFVIFTTYGNEEDLLAFASRLCRSVAAIEIEYEGRRIPMTASFGVVRISPGESFDDAMLAVDEALYKAKSEGRNKVVLGEIKRRQV